MIKYNLKCNNDHEFESWFSDSSEFDKLEKKKLLECIYCGSKKINKSIMAPSISFMKQKTHTINRLSKSMKKEKYKLLEIRRFIEKNFEFVGSNFSTKVRDIYYDKNSKKTIYGTTTAKERQELAEEGIELISVPWISKDN